MKRLLLIMMVLLVSCSGRPSDADCESAKLQVTAENPGEFGTYKEYIEATKRPLTAIEVHRFLNTEYPPDSVGAMLKACINGGWDGWR